jgi:hypothetical protein
MASSRRDQRGQRPAKIRPPLPPVVTRRRHSAGYRDAAENQRGARKRFRSRRVPHLEPRLRASLALSSRLLNAPAQGGSYRSAAGNRFSCDEEESTRVCIARKGFVRSKVPVGPLRNRSDKRHMIVFYPTESCLLPNPHRRERHRPQGYQRRKAMGTYVAATGWRSDVGK